MSLTTQIKKLIHTPTDSQLLSIRLPTSKVNQIDELAQELDKTRSEVISTFIDGGIEELLKQLEELRPNECLPELHKVDDATAPRYFLLNTNFNNSEEDHFNMLQLHEASAFYEGWKENISYLRDGDMVFLYQSGYGICALGKVAGDLIVRDHNGNQSEWYSRKLTEFLQLEKPITAKSCKDITKSNFNFRKTMVSLTKDQGDSLLAAIHPGNAVTSVA